MNFSLCTKQTQNRKAEINDHSKCSPHNKTSLSYGPHFIAGVVFSLHVCLFCDPMHCSPQGSPVCGIFQTRILEWVAIFFSRGSTQPRDQTHVSCISRQILYHWATTENHFIGRKVKNCQLFLPDHRAGMCNSCDSSLGLWHQIHTLSVSHTASFWWMRLYPESCVRKSPDSTTVCVRKKNITQPPTTVKCHTISPKLNHRFLKFSYLWKWE